MRFIKDFKPNVVGYTFEDVPSHKTTHSVGISRELFLNNNIIEFRVPEYVLVHVQSFQVYRDFFCKKLT